MTVYCFNGGTEQHYYFTQEEIDAANGKLKCLLSKLSPLLKDEPMISSPMQKVFPF